MSSRRCLINVARDTGNKDSRPHLMKRAGCVSRIALKLMLLEEIDTMTNGNFSWPRSRGGCRGKRNLFFGPICPE